MAIVFSSSYRSPSVLSLSLHPSSVGHVVLDGFGVVPGSFGAWDLAPYRTTRVREDAVDRLLLDALWQYRPLRVVLGIAACGSPRAQRYAQRIAHLLRRRHIQFTVRANHAGVQLVLGTNRSQYRTQLAETLVRCLLPELAPFIEGPGAEEDYRRDCFYAAALGVLELAAHHPRVAAALIQPRGRATLRLLRFLAATDRRLTPSL